MSQIPEDVLDDLSSRFLLNMPDDEKCDAVRVCFQLEQAHWFYTDYYAANSEEYEDCPQTGVRNFFRQLLAHSIAYLSLPPQKNGKAATADSIIDTWREYKHRVPTYGAILLDSSLNFVLLVQGYYAKNSWGFPKGKVNESETPERCAAREVYEEIGYDVSKRLRSENSLCATIGTGNAVQLFIITKAPVNYEYRPHTRNEIRKIQWFRVRDLPTDKTGQHAIKYNINPSNFHTVIPFVKQLRNWIFQARFKRALKELRPLVKMPDGYDTAINGKTKQKIKSKARRENARVIVQESMKEADDDATFHLAPVYTASDSSTPITAVKKSSSTRLRTKSEADTAVSCDTIKMLFCNTASRSHRSHTEASHLINAAAFDECQDEISSDNDESAQLSCHLSGVQISPMSIIEQCSSEAKYVRYPSPKRRGRKVDLNEFFGYQSKPTKSDDILHALFAGTNGNVNKPVDVRPKEAPTFTHEPMLPVLSTPELDECLSPKKQDSFPSLHQLPKLVAPEEDPISQALTRHLASDYVQNAAVTLAPPPNLVRLQNSTIDISHPPPPLPQSLMLSLADRTFNQASFQ